MTRRFPIGPTAVIRRTACCSWWMRSDKRELRSARPTIGVTGSLGFTGSARFGPEEKVAKTRGETAPYRRPEPLLAPSRTKRAGLLAELRGVVLAGLLVASPPRLGAPLRHVNGRARFAFMTCSFTCATCSRSSSAVRDLVAARFSHVLIDEFQDTDPIQLEIVRLLGEKDGEPTPGALFFVGDPRQSIYRFRGADPQLYEDALVQMAPAGPVRLFANFRSVPGVLNWVNSVFAPLFGGSSDDDGGCEAARRGELFTALVPTRRAISDVAAVTVLGGPSDGPELALERRTREADDLAAAISTVVVEGWPIETDGELRPARLGDIAILVPCRTGLSSLEAALDAARSGLPGRVDDPRLRIERGP